MSFSVIAGALMLACSVGDVTTVEPPVFEPVLKVNGHTLAPFYAEWIPSEGDPDLGDIMMLPAADIIRISLNDGIDTFRAIDVRVYDQRPSETAIRLAEAECSNLHTAPLPEDNPDTVSGPIRLLECVMDNENTHLAIDVSALAQRCSVLYIVVPVIWWPEVAPEGPVHPDFRTASWAFSLPPACDTVSGADDVEAAVDMDYRTGGGAEPV